MKPMSKAEGKKRKREPPPIIPEVKKSKVHAQRKFAQGTGGASPSVSPVKERDRVKTTARVPATPPEPLLTNKVPTTNQFLDFLCFGRTTLLPPELHYLREASLSQSSSSAPSVQSPPVTSGKKAEKPKAVDDSKQQSSNVQALRKKYQQQRLAKQKPTSVTTLAKKVKGKIMVRTRSAVGTEEVVKKEKASVLGLRSGLKRAHNAVAMVKARKQKAQKAKLQRAGLRSAGKVEPPKKVAKDKVVNKTKKTEQEEPMKTKTVEGTKKSRHLIGGELMSDFSSDDNEPLLATKKQRLRTAVQQHPKSSKVLTRSKKVGDEETKDSESREGRPSRRTKAAAAVYVEEISRKLNSSSPSRGDDSTETFPELPSSKRMEAKTTTKKPSEKKSVPKNPVKKDLKKIQTPKTGDSPARPSTRSTADKQQVRLTVTKAKIRNLIQKKKQNSLRMLTRLKMVSAVGKPSVNNIKSKVTLKSEKVKVTEKKEEKEPTTPVRSLRGKTLNVSPVEKPTKQKLQLNKKTETKVKETKNEGNERKEKAKQKGDVADNLTSKRPVRKCSTIDKIWIDVDGFTSDEDDFIDVESITAATSDKKTVETLQKGKPVKKASSSETPSKEKGTGNKKQATTPAAGAAKDTKGKKAEPKTVPSGAAKNVVPPASSGTAPTKKDAPIPNTTSTTALVSKVTTTSEADISKIKKSEAPGNKVPETTNFPTKGSKQVLSSEKLSNNCPVKSSVVQKTDIIPKETPTTSPISGYPEHPARFNPHVVTPNKVEVPNFKGTDKVSDSAVPCSSPPQQENSHSLIARLASNVSMTSKPSTLTIDLKSKDLKTSSSSIGIKEEKIKSEAKFSTGTYMPLFDVEDKKDIVGLLPQLSHETDQIMNKDDSKVSSIVKKVPEKCRPKENEKVVEVQSSKQSNSKLAKLSESTANFLGDTSKSDVIKVPSLPTLINKNKGTQEKASKNQQGSSKKELGTKLDKVVADPLKKKSSKAKDDQKKEGGKDREKVSGIGKTIVPKKVAAIDLKRKKVDSESSDESEESTQRKPRGKIGRKPSPRAEVVTRRERPKRQCSATGKSWIERDSDDSSFYDDAEEDVMELIRRSELALQKREERKQRRLRLSESAADSKGGASEHFSDSDDEPLMKKTCSANSPGSLFTSDSKDGMLHAKNSEGKSEVPQERVDRAGASGLVEIQAPVPTEVPVTFHKVPREPINTHGLDLLSEVVAVADKSNARIEQWLKASHASQAFLGFDESEIRHPPHTVANSSIPDPFFQIVRLPPQPPRAVVADVKKVLLKPEVIKRPPVSSVHDLLKLQKERKETPKPSPEQHSKNCKCNSCVVKKAWFKNKPVPDDPKPPAKDMFPPKPFQSLTQAFGEVTTAKASVTVAPFVQSRDDASSKPGTGRKLSFLERMRERERKEALVKPSNQPFSPSHESSVYAFEPEEKQSTPFKTPPRAAARSSSRTPSTSTSHDEDGDDERARHQSTSIAVQVNLDTSAGTPEPLPVDDGKSIEISTQTEGEDEEADSQMYYIPLQQSNSGTSSQQPLIQGVTVKLGTEGPVGPHQKLVMQAKLVTKPPNMPSMKAVVMPQQKSKESTKNTPPVGTVQPTTRRPPGLTTAPRARDSTSPSSAKTRDAQISARVDTKSQVTPMRLESPLASSTPRPPKDTPKPSASSAPEPGQSSRESSMLMEAPTFHLTEKEFQDPLEFFERIRPAAERFGLCRIVPPSSFKPDCKVADDMRFTAHNQYVHRMLHRWGPSVRETMAMKKYLKTQRISLKPPPCVGGMEVDLPRLYQAVQSCGGLMKVMEKQKWQQVADILRIPKAAHDRATKLDSIYCQYLLPYDTLKSEERNKLLEEVDADWAAHEEKMGQENEEEGEDYIEECEECIVKGRSMALSQFYRIARNTMSMWFKSAEPAPDEVEAEFWRHVTERKHHVCVHSGSIDSSGWGYGFPVGKNNFAKHPWNLKVLTNNIGSVLRSLGPVMGVTVPTLYVGMVFAAICWYRDPHGLPWVEYLHTGAPKIWYGISDDNSSLFREALTKLLPKHIKEERIWLPCETAMAPPARLVELGVPLSRTTQHPGQFVLVFPRAFTSSLCTGYLVSESVYFARSSWLQTAEQAFRDIQDSAEPSVFSLDNLLISIAADTKSSLEILIQVLPMVQRVREREENGRRALRDMGLTEERLPRETTRRRGRTADRRRGRTTDPEPEYECEICRASLFLSMVSNAAEETVYCLRHGVEQLTSHKDQVQGSKLIYTYHQDEINKIVEALQERIDSKASKNNKK